MSLTPSAMLPLGTIAPDFTLPDVSSGTDISLHDAKSPIATVIMFICNHCPFVKHVRDKVIDVARIYQQKNIAFIAICSNDSKQYSADAPDQMKKIAQEYHFPFPYLFDETQEVAKKYHAQCTPDFFIFDKSLSCVYRGQFDDSRPGNNISVTGNNLSSALDAILSGKSVNDNQKPSIGCN